MIAYLRGEIIHVTVDSITVLTQGGIGYMVAVPRLFAAEQRVGETISLHTYLKVSDSAQDLYGFISADERAFFELLLTVKGVGPKSAMNILSLGDMDTIQDAIARSDAKYLSAVQGMGKKTAERLCVELKGKVHSSTVARDVNGAEGGALGDVVDALTSLGYTSADAREAVKQLNAQEKEVEELIREALQILS